MKRRIRNWSIAGIVILCLAGFRTVQAEPNRTSSELQLTLELTDGSKIVGKPDREDFELATPYATILIPLKETRQITLNRGEKGDAVLMRNGDQLSGVVRRFPVRFTTLFGKIKLDEQNMRQVSVSRRYAKFPVTITESRVLYLPFDSPVESGDLVCDSKAIEVIGGRWIPDGAVGGGYEFTEDGYIDLVPTKQFATQGELSGCAWIRRQDRHLIVLSNYKGGSDYTGQFIFGIDGIGRFEAVLGQATGVSVRYVSAQSDFIPINEWHHIAFTYSESRNSGDKIRFYLDGNPCPAIAIGEGNGGRILDSFDRIRLMGHRDNRALCRSHGSIDEVMLFDRALSDEEIPVIAHSFRDQKSCGFPLFSNEIQEDHP